jgi:hypothetical protein
MTEILQLVPFEVWAALGGLLTFLGIRASGYRRGRKDERTKGNVADLERAERTRGAADAARRRSADDGRDPDERLRDHGRFRE